MPSLHEQKTALRKHVAKKAAQLGAAYLAASDAAIRAALLGRPEIERAKTVFCYVSVGNEPDTRVFIQDMLARGKAVVVPRCLGDGVMQARRITSFDELLPASFGLLEPSEDSPLVSPAGVDLVIAPCVAAGREGARLGHGAGYYDRFLCRTHCSILCLCRGKLLLSGIPMDKNDIYMDAVITEDGVFENTLR